ncbi:hypothetical protein GMORB2_5032 [Geosmithia morbida]|uniref:Uncharacterized protein n=1 Tax=Geosmithia morbida TaxID=1094350 RepID=A0A9P5D5A8_9HYPO|nr:uncharacterized protein GMORB2_5032 [Geosmithia morbida]KAF4124366.1 hypothetical protein GMORB2_5032 [Geosmithia morbida]
MASTPSPAPAAAELPSTPPAPRFGSYYDNWEPYQPRKSARIANRSANRTPSPSASHRRLDSAVHKQQQPAKTTSVPKRRLPSTTSAPTDNMDSQGTSPAPKRSAKPVASASSSRMLPTPTKTPRKPPTAKQTAELDSVRRDIFSPSLSSRAARTPKKISGSTLESFLAEEVAQDFTIFSDSCNRIPEKDESNPFYNPRPSKQTKAQGKRKHVRIPGEGMESIEKAAGREDGLLMNFRGKTIYRPLSKPGNDESEDADELADERSFSKRKLEPRLLFPKESMQEKVVNPEEEEVTDIEDGNLDSEPPSPDTPPRTRKIPNAPKFPASPPPTQRTTRSADKLASAKRATQPVLNFGSVAKSHKSSATATKRSGEPLGRDAPKRSRTEA